jgi:hypothetical protein
MSSILSFVTGKRTDFLSRDELRLSITERELGIPTRDLLFFATSSQQTWLVITDKTLLIFLDSLRSNDPELLATFQMNDICTAQDFGIHLIDGEDSIAKLRILNNPESFLVTLKLFNYDKFQASKEILEIFEDKCSLFKSGPTPAQEPSEEKTVNQENSDTPDV